MRLHCRAAAGTVLIAASASAAVFTAAEAGEQKQPGQIGSAEIVEHYEVPPFMMIRRVFRRYNTLCGFRRFGSDGRGSFRNGLTKYAFRMIINRINGGDNYGTERIFNG